jgi:cellulose synthase/poly-beta-1,6-N-acetylglucosamine synthase-like glycosyltransferase
MDLYRIIFEYYIFIYVALSCSLYLLLGFSAYLGIRRYKTQNSENDQNIIFDAPDAPGISVVAPAFNEAKTIIENVKSLMTLNYPVYEIIIINDGSSDDTLELLINEFDLVETPFAYLEKIAVPSFKRVLKSKKSKYSELTVVDKTNTGTKADAVNAGINASSNYPYFLFTDVDCILNRNTLINMIKPVLNSKVRTVAVGSSLWMSNGCKVHNGKIIKIAPPKKIIPRFQVIEYLRAYLLGKMGWSFINAVPNVSGALALYDKEIVTACGGYDTNSHAEDMDIMIRVAAYMIQNKLPYKIEYIPSVCCYTEGPANVKILGRQRTRWASGLAQIFTTHREKFFNYRFKKIGFIVFPLTFLFEFLAPIIEFIGLIYFISLLLFGTINWPLFGYTFLFSYTFGISIGTLMLVYEQYVKQNYSSIHDKLKVWIMLLFEPFLYHPILVYFSIKGYLNFFLSRKVEWGKMTREGFKKSS